MRSVLEGAVYGGGGVGVDEGLWMSDPTERGGVASGGICCCGSTTVAAVTSVAAMVVAAQVATARPSLG